MPFQVWIPKRQQKERGSLKPGRSRFSSRITSPQCGQNCFLEAFSNEQQSSLKKQRCRDQEGAEGQQASPLRQPQDWPVPGNSVFTVRGGEPGPAGCAPCSPRRGLNREPSSHSAPWNPGQAVAAAAAPPSRSANRRAVLPVASPTPGRELCLPDWAVVVTVAGCVEPGAQERLWRALTLQGRPVKDGTLEKVKEKEKPNVQAAPSGHRVAWARHAELWPKGDRVTAWQFLGDGRGAPWPQATLRRGPERDSGSPVSQSSITQIRGE